jgi:membrane-associated phospholipid phosphatase
MIGIGGFTGMLIAISQILGAPILSIIIISILIAGLLGSSRLVLNAHTPLQVYTGFLIGLFTEWWLITGLSR